MTAAIIHLPPDPARLRAGLDAVRARARALRATPSERARAVDTLLREMHDGRSTGAAVALANSTFPRPARAAHGWSAS